MGMNILYAVIVLGGFSEEQRYEVQTILLQDEFSDLMQFIKDEKIDAFITAGNVSEVYGTWFKHYHHKRIPE